MPVVTEVAQAIVDGLNSASFSQPFTAERHYCPKFDLAEMDALHVTVVPKAMEVSVPNRSLTQYDVQIDIAVQQRFSEDTNDVLDPLMELVQEIADHFKGRKLGTNTIWIKTENAPIFAQEHMQEMRQFTSLLTLTLRVIK